MIEGVIKEIVFCDLTDDQVGELVVPLLLSPVDYGEELIQVFENWAERAQSFSRELQNRALWRIIGSPLNIGWILSREDVAVDLRERMIRSMRCVTTAVPVVTPPGEPMENGYFMWWDLVCDDLEDPGLIQVCLEVLTDLLQIPDANIQWCALHGLGHLQHPRRAEVVSEFMVRMGQDTYNDEEWQWMLECRDGTVM